MNLENNDHDTYLIELNKIQKILLASNYSFELIFEDIIQPLSKVAKIKKNPESHLTIKNNFYNYFNEFNLCFLPQHYIDIFKESFYIISNNNELHLSLKLKLDFEKQTLTEEILFNKSTFSLSDFDDNMNYLKDIHMNDHHQLNSLQQINNLSLNLKLEQILPIKTFDKKHKI